MLDIRHVIKHIHRNTFINHILNGTLRIIIIIIIIIIIQAFVRHTLSASEMNLMRQNFYILFYTRTCVVC